MSDGQRTWAGVRPFLLERLGEDAVAQIEERMRDARGFLGAPQTFIAEIQRLASAPGELTPSQVVAFLSGLPQLQAEADADAVRDAEVLDHPAAQALTAVLEAARQKLGPVVVSEAASRITTPGALARLIPSGSRALMETDLSFEERAAHVLRMVHSFAEGMYKATLSMAYDLHMRANDRPERAKPELGAVFHAIQLGVPELLPLLDPRVLLARNSESHRHTLYDARAETVTLINRPGQRDERSETLGKEEFAAWIKESGDLFVAMLAVVRQFARPW